MKREIEVYNWIKGELVTKTTIKSRMNKVEGWRETPERAMINKHNVMSYNIKNEIYMLKNRLSELRKLEDSIEQIGLNVDRLEVDI